MFIRLFPKTLLFIGSFLFLCALFDQTTYPNNTYTAKDLFIPSAHAQQNDTPVLYYHISGGFAGICNEIYIYENGDAKHSATCRDKPEPYSPDKDSIKGLMAYLDTIPHAYSTSWYYTFAKDKEPECCDQFIIKMKYKGQAVHFSRLSESENTALNTKIDAIQPDN